MHCCTYTVCFCRKSSEQLLHACMPWVQKHERAGQNHLSRPQAKQKKSRKTGVVDLHMV